MTAIDIHTHILPKELPDFAKKFGDSRFVSLKHTKPNCAEMIQDGKPFRNVDHRLWDEEVRKKECDRNNVDIQVLSTVPVMFSYWAPPAQGLEVARFLNNHIAQTVEKNPKRFLGLGTVPLQDVDLSVREMQRCKHELKLSGIEIGTHVNEMNLDDAKLFPFYEAAQGLNLPLFVHAWDMLGKERMEKYWLPWLVGMPTETTVAIASMILGGVFDRFPKLRVAFSHGGGAFAQLLGRISHGFRARPDLCATQTQTDPKRYVGRFWVDSAVHDAATLHFLIEKLGVKSIALGSDYPFPLGEDEPGSLIRSLQNIKESDRKRMLLDSGKAWLGL